MNKNTGKTRYETNAALLHSVVNTPDVAKGRETFNNYLLGMIMNTVSEAEFASMVLLAEAMVKENIAKGQYVY